jgi:tetratricopeptide (TPR) repeat protein
MLRVLFALFSSLAATCAMSAVDVSALWDFSDPKLSERRFREALNIAAGDDRLILQTQIARTYALRKDFSAARDVLQAIASAVADAGAEARARYWLELGRTHASHRHDPASQTPQSLTLARNAFSTALTIARAARLDDLVIDALHMFVFVDTAPEDQLRWNREALAVIAQSEQPAAKRWEASIRSNAGEALYDLGRFDEALEFFQRALFLREQSADARGARDARWHIARILRVKNQLDDALEIQLSLEREADAAQQPRYYIYEELQLIYQAKGDSDRAVKYGRRAKALRH